MAGPPASQEQCIAFESAGQETKSYKPPLLKSNFIIFMLEDILAMETELKLFS